MRWLLRCSVLLNLIVFLFMAETARRKTVTRLQVLHLTFAVEQAEERGMISDGGSMKLVDIVNLMVAEGLLDLDGSTLKVDDGGVSNRFGDHFELVIRAGDQRALVRPRGPSFGWP